MGPRTLVEPMSKFEKRVAIYLFTHVVVYSLVYRVLRREGKTDAEAKSGSHVIGAVTGFVLTAALV